MNWSATAKQNPLITAQKAVKIFLIRADHAISGLRMYALRLRKGQGFVLKEVQGSRMFLNTADKGISTDLCLRGIREDKATAEFQSRLRAGQVIADIGANIGYYALMEAKAVGPKGLVYAIEPIEENVALLKKNIKANGYGNIEVFCKAIGDENCEKEMFLSRKSNLATFSAHEDRDKSGKTRKVELCTLDRFLKGRRMPEIVRMDVEGYELEILRGMKKTLKESPHLELFLEVHAQIMGPEKTISVLRLLKENGFRTGRALFDSPDVLKFAGRFLSKDVLPEIGTFDKSIEEMIEDERFSQGLYHLFAEKGK